jgi:hypothetical protein
MMITVSVQTTTDTMSATYQIDDFTFDEHGIMLIFGKNERVFFPYTNLIKVRIESNDDDLAGRSFEPDLM